MARASAARAAPSPILPHPPDLAPPRRAPLIGCPPTPLAGRTEPALRPRYCSDPGTTNALRLGLPWLGRTQRAGRIAASRAPASTVATAASLGAPGARRLHQCQAVLSSETPESPGQGDCCNLRWAPAEANPRKGKQMHGSSANWTRIHLPLDLGIDFVKDYVMESREARDVSSEAAGELIKCFKWSRCCIMGGGDWKVTAEPLSLE
nr:uncharacterized protein LOC114091041 [Marmota flaviventris]